ncbi:MAG: transglycosylase SLT domain-containing protein, partial [Deltaproteobacteria bacterium]|nr:transglycosylase SLT domain-containing protein [Deltaproteobacteria bacterium]
MRIRSITTIFFLVIMLFTAVLYAEDEEITDTSFLSDFESFSEPKITGKFNINNYEYYEQKVEKEKSVIQYNSKNIFSTYYIDNGRIGYEETPPFFYVEVLKKSKEGFDIPVIYNEDVAKFIKYFTGRGKKSFQKWLERSKKYRELLTGIIKENKLPQDTIYLAMIESGFSPFALSRSGAAGIWQFIPSTGRRYGLRVDYWVDERRDPVRSTYAAVAYLKNLYRYFGSWWLAWAGYNAGEGRIMRAISKAKSNDFWEIADRRFIRRETRQYVPKLMAAALITANPEKYGFYELEYQTEFEFDEVIVPPATDIRVIANAALTDYYTIWMLNPALRRGITPPDTEYSIRIPKGTKDIFTENFSKLPRDKLLEKREVIIAKSVSLKDFAKKEGTSYEALIAFNPQIKPESSLSKGTKVIIPMFSIIDEELEKRYDKKIAKASRKKKGKSNKISVSVNEYVVEEGDNPYDIAKKHNVNLNDLMEINGLDRGCLL